MNPLVSVVIPAYNVEKFLRSGIKSIQAQKYKNMEIIIVDDGSTDSTYRICEELSREDNRIHIFHKENGGSGSARNFGIDYANGKYLYFFDIDDSVDSDFISDSVAYAENKNVDLIIYGYYVRSSDSFDEEVISINEHDIITNDELKKVYCNELLWMKHGNGFVWNKFYRKSFLDENKIRFGNQKVQQDEIFNMLLYPKLNRVYICPKIYYHYVIYNKDNASSKFIIHKEKFIEDVHRHFLNFYKLWKLDDEKVKKYIDNRYLSGMFNIATVNYFHNNCTLDKKTKKAIIRTIVKKVNEEAQKLDYGKNPINNIQIWSFNHGKYNLLIFSTKVKNILKKLMGR